MYLTFLVLGRLAQLEGLNLEVSIQACIPASYYITTVLAAGPMTYDYL